MKQPGEHKGAINIWTAVILFAALAVWAVVTLKGIALAVALIVVGALAIKSYLHFLRSRME